MFHFKVGRQPDGWVLMSPDFTFEALAQVFPTRRAAITSVQEMKEAERVAWAILHRLEDES